MRVHFTRGTDVPPRVEVIVCTPALLRYWSEVVGIARVSLEARTVDDLIRISRCVDEPTRKVLRNAWLWKCTRELELGFDVVIPHIVREPKRIALGRV